MWLALSYMVLRVVKAYYRQYKWTVLVSSVWQDWIKYPITSLCIIYDWNVCVLINFYLIILISRIAYEGLLSLCGIGDSTADISGTWCILEYAVLLKIYSESSNNMTWIAKY
jgi:hypothetical protein